MYVEEIALEGFKTYMNRTVISGFDPNFNAITGLNGSGKSNILDAIQFVLGSTSKQMLRLKTGLTQLIYKEGFAGIQKAQVTIKFRCPDKNMRPIGFENHQQLSITRQITKDKITKFFVNGQNSNLSKVKNLFRSVQLNIQNPHFLVKQGQITKIINLKPLQLLGMIEETAGTAYYNKTRTESEKIIQRKQQKLHSINQILSTTIKPQMDKLQIDRKKYAVFKQKEVLADRINKKIKKHEYAIKLLETRNTEYKITTYKDTMQRMTRQKNELTTRLVEIENQIKILRQKGNDEALKDYNNMKNLLLEKQNKRNTIKNRLQIIQTESLKQQQQSKRNEQTLQRLKQQIQEYQKKVIQTQKQISQFEDLLNDLSNSTSEQQAIKLIEKQIVQEKSTINGIRQETKMLESKKNARKAQAQNQQTSIHQIKKQMDDLNIQIRTLEKEIQEFKKMEKPIPKEDPELQVQELRQLEQKRQNIIKQNHRLAFFFQDPSPGFNRSFVRGKLFMIFKVHDRNHQKALQIGVGAKINNIVVQNQIASQILVKAQSFGQNATYIPNNKIKAYVLRQEILNQVGRIAHQCGGFARVAYELVDYPADLKNTILFAFGGFVVCQNSELAKRIAFNKNKALSCKCVTYDGDVYEPGTVTGGSEMNPQYIISKYRQVFQIDQKIKIQKTKNEKKIREFQEYSKKMSSYQLMEKQIEGKIARKQRISQKVSSLSLNTKPRDFSDEIESIEKKILGLNKQLGQHENKVKDLSSKTKKGSMKSVDEQKKSLLHDKKKCQDKLSQQKKRVSLNQVQIQRLYNNLKLSDETMRQHQKQIRELQKLQQDIHEDIKFTKISFINLQAKKVQYEKEMALNNNQVQSLNTEAQKSKRKLEQGEQMISNMKSEIQIMEKQVIQNERVLATILANNNWLQSQNQRVIEVDPDFNYSQAVKQCSQILLEVDKLRKTVKVNVDDHSYQKLNEQYRNLLEKKGILQNDKKTLITNMHQLDDKRTKTLEACFKLVKQNLSTIFNDLLPGATAHLTLVDQIDVTKGAQLRVHFNNVKKELSQLSGGQRSLLALSFILALLLYKPSPFYILDQIDSALDLSHTENIGYMISRRFPQSQFLLISLKEGMFQNANVLYKVHFAQGQSKVDRQVLKKKR